jgi:hypothetical protein
MGRWARMPTPRHARRPFRPPARVAARSHASSSAAAPPAGAAGGARVGIGIRIGIGAGFGFRDWDRVRDRDRDWDRDRVRTGIGFGFGLGWAHIYMVEVVPSHCGGSPAAAEADAWGAVTRAARASTSGRLRCARAGGISKHGESFAARGDSLSPGSLTPTAATRAPCARLHPTRWHSARTAG